MLNLLTIRNNSISALDVCDVFSPNASIRFLYLSHNMLPTVNFTECLHFIQTLTMTNNEIKDFPYTTADNGINTLDISGNHTEIIDGTEISKLEHMKILSLSSNNIRAN